ncbi:RecQ family ATP-dependent DNA helicase [Gemmatimonadota bacterium]
MLYDSNAAHRELDRCFGYPGFRPGQEELICAVVEGRDALGILPTGGGKSVCYQIPALLFPGLTLVVSPLISLMEDQVNRANGAGASAAFLNSTQPASEAREAISRAEAGELRLLFIAPERFEVPAFRSRLPKLGVSLLAVDEAHCISEWGHDFRPSYLRLGRVRESLSCPVLALTATATPRVREEICSQLRLADPLVTLKSFDRPNLSWEVSRATGHGGKLRRLRALVRGRSGSLLVYAPTRRTVEVLRDQLASLGLPVEAYHAGLTGEERARVQEEFMAGRRRIVVATNAFGMGVDKSDVRLVVHYQLSGTLEGYYQEAGRAGRDGDPAKCVALYDPRDSRTHFRMLDGNHPPIRLQRRAYRALRTEIGAGGSEPLPLPRMRALLGSRVSEPELLSLLRSLEREGCIRLLTPLAEAHELDEPCVNRGGGGEGCGIRGEHLRKECEVTVGVYSREPDFRRCRRLREIAVEKLRAVRRYALARGCRRRVLLAYFGEQIPDRPCGGCDHCRG